MTAVTDLRTHGIYQNHQRSSVCGQRHNYSTITLEDPHITQLLLLINKSKDKTLDDAIIESYLAVFFNIPFHT